MKPECENTKSCWLYCEAAHSFFVWVLSDLKIWHGDGVIDSHTSEELCSLLRKDHEIRVRD